MRMTYAVHIIAGSLALLSGYVALYAPEGSESASQGRDGVRLRDAHEAWLGLLASVPLAVLLPAMLTGFIKGPVANVIWLPMLVFEVTLGLWLLSRGVPTSVPETYSNRGHSG